MTQPLSTIAPGPLMAGKRGLVMGVANERSIAWGIARTLSAHGAQLAFTYQGAAFGKRVRPLAEGIGADLLLDCDVTDEAQTAAAFDAIGEAWGSLDFLVHAVAYSDKRELKGRYADTTRENFLRTMDISCYSFTDCARRAAALMPDGGSMATLTFEGSNRVMPNYNVMGVAKAALEASVRYLANDFGPQGVRVNAISAGPMRTLAGSAIGDARFVYRWNRDHAPLRRTVDLDDVGGAALYLMSDLGKNVTGECVRIDAGFHVLGMPHPQNLNQAEREKD